MAESLFDAVAPATKPFIKWAGGKSRLLAKLLPYVPNEIVNYHEPFLGGGAMYFALADRVAGVSYLSDLNEELVNAWLAVKDHRDELEAALEDYRAKDAAGGKDFYLSVRPLEPSGVVARAARFLYLNQTSWNGLWRVNRWGKFNVPWGDRPFRGLTRHQIDSVSLRLQNADIGLRDFRDAITLARPGDFVYLDPPYLPISDTSKFYLYTEKRFRAPDLRELADLCDDLSERGVSWMMSNRDTPLVRELFAGHEIVSLTTRRSVAAQNKRDVEPSDSLEAIVIGRS
ncbi:DNA adenine methylase [Nocardia farcinica]|uniref:DNA adenine methylase n=1 Tax=Nocardia farcinica TaxID=37329 RepID=UPI0018960DD9|nr:DNA adenine methylase [Nocardia farcinica]MBF6271611.1 DNA adenine methylase [Nocardia farcinica]MBF6422845.1 DNA adenine methylase [Nocardia farcinica]MBF6434555.1 DNA adenine methylase [Nocardia farcinica]MBF6505664.1 DNA adenine methylase [Nocardia farcinica]